jgi:hypothetical protein
MLIVKNFSSFYVELEVLLCFVFDFRYWSQNKDDNMMNETQSEMNWIAQRNQVKINSWIKLWTAILRNVFCRLCFDKCPKLQIVIIDT